MYLYFETLIYGTIFIGMGNVFEADATLLCWNTTKTHKLGWQQHSSPSGEQITVLWEQEEPASDHSDPADWEKFTEAAECNCKQPVNKYNTYVVIHATKS